MKDSNLKQFFRFAGWSAYVSVAAMFASVLFVVFELGGVFDTLGGISTLILALSMLPIALALHRICRVSNPELSIVTVLIGAGAMLAAVSVQVLRLFGAVGLEELQSIPFAVIGLWLLFAGYLTYTTSALPRGLAWLSIAAGAGMVLVIAGFVVSYPPPLWGFAGEIVFVIAYSIWAIWLGRLFLSGKLTISEQSASMRGETA